MLPLFTGGHKLYYWSKIEKIGSEPAFDFFITLNEKNYVKILFFPPIYASWIKLNVKRYPK
jgi:hypothetical protein